MLVGFFALVTRRKAVSQIVGILLVDNGVALVAFLATAGVPLIVELGASLDVLLAVVVLRVLAIQMRCASGVVRPRPTDGAARLMLVAVLLLPLVGGLLSGVVPWRRGIGWLGTATASGVLGRGSRAGRRMSCTASPPTALDGVLRADALSAFMVIVIGVIATLATWQGVRYLDAEIAAGRCTRRHAALYASSSRPSWPPCSSRCWPPTWACCGWPSRRRRSSPPSWSDIASTRSSLEASWKYIVICSVGIALAFLGTVLVYLASLQRRARAASPSTGRRWWPQSHHLNPGVMRLAFALIVLGYGTKVGLAPMHSWLPDAHSQAPAPVSALMSGVLLTVAFYAILRFKVDR